VIGYSGPKIEVNIQELNKAIQGNFLKRYRKKNKLTQNIIAQYLGISRMHYWRIEEGKPVGKNIIRKIEGKLAQVEKGQ